MNDLANGMLIGFGGLGVVLAGIRSAHRWRHRGNAKVRLLAKQYQAMTNSAEREISMEMLAKPDLIYSRMEFRKIEAIEAELINDSDGQMARELLKSFFKGEDPWVRARAAKALYPLDTRAALTELQSLVHNSSPYVQVSGIWALGELATPQALEILLSLVGSKDQEIQEALIRCLVQMENKQRIPPESQAKVKHLLKELRFKADWIL
jgi:hypothetical protein